MSRSFALNDVRGQSEDSLSVLSAACNLADLKIVMR